jgi:hypothetical protein
MDDNGVFPDRAEFERRIAVLESEKLRRSECYSKLVKISCIIAAPVVILPIIYFSFAEREGFAWIFIRAILDLYQGETQPLISIFWGITAIVAIFLKPGRRTYLLSVFALLYICEKIYSSSMNWIQIAASDGTTEIILLCIAEIAHSVSLPLIFAGILAAKKFSNYGLIRMSIFFSGILFVLSNSYFVVSYVWYSFNLESDVITLSRIIGSIACMLYIIAGIFALLSLNIKTRDIGIIFVNRAISFVISAWILHVAVVLIFMISNNVFSSTMETGFRIIDMIDLLFVAIVIGDLLTRFAFNRWSKDADAEISRMRQEMAALPE